MKAVWKILKIILAFALSLAIIAVVWYGVELSTLEEGEPAVPFIDFILYLLGFGDINTDDHYLQTAFSTLGLFAVTLLSSVFTVNLFDLRSQVKILSKLTVPDQHRGKLELKAAGKDVYNLTAVLIAKCGQDVTTQEQFFPFIAKRSLQELQFDLAPGTPLYKYLRARFGDAQMDSQLILTLSYTDIESGQEYVTAQKFQYSPQGKSDFVFGAAGELESAIREHIRGNTFAINLASVWACEAEDMDISYGDGALTQQQAFRADVHMNGNRIYEPRTFTMAVTGELLGNDWRVYRDLGCALKFDYWVQGDMTVTMELKYGTDRVQKYECALRPKGDFQSYGLDLRQFDREQLENVRELCFTVFYKDVDPASPVGSFAIRNCVLEVEG